MRRAKLLTGCTFKLRYTHFFVASDKGDVVVTALSLLQIYLVQYIINRRKKGRLLIRFYDCFTVVNKEDKGKAFY